MEPTIYKPGAYKSPGIYKGAGGIYKGRGVYNDGEKEINYFSDFTNFDLSTKIDRPKKGPLTNYFSNNIDYSFGEDCLIATSKANPNSDTVGLSFVKKNGTILETEFVISHPSGNPPSFIWCEDFGFDNDYARTNFEFLVSTTKNYTLFNGTFRNRTDAGFNWFSYPETAGVNFFNVKILYGDITEIYVDDNKVIYINDFISDNQVFQIRPSRKDMYIKLRYLKIENAVSFDGGV